MTLQGLWSIYPTGIWIGYDAFYGSLGPLGRVHTCAGKLRESLLALDDAELKGVISQTLHSHAENTPSTTTTGEPQTGFLEL